MICTFTESKSATDDVDDDDDYAPDVVERADLIGQKTAVVFHVTVQLVSAER